MQLNDLLLNEGIQPEHVLVLRHRPFEPELRKVLPWYAAERPEIFNAYQQTQQNPRVETAFQKATHIASFIGHESRKALFVGLYKRGGWHPMGYDEYWSVPAYKEMKAFGIEGFTGARDAVFWFDLELTDFYASGKGASSLSGPGLSALGGVGPTEIRSRSIQFWKRASLKPRCQLGTNSFLLGTS